jgi:hypothetical protein
LQAAIAVMSNQFHLSHRQIPACWAPKRPEQSKQAKSPAATELQGEHHTVTTKLCHDNMV